LIGSDVITKRITNIYIVSVCVCVCVCLSCWNTK